MKIVCVVGARPQFVKIAPLVRVLKKKPMIDLLIVHTGQHYDELMSAVFFDDLNLPEPKYNLHVGSSTHAQQTAKMLVGVEDVLRVEKPDWLIVVGDTNSTLAGALAAKKLRIPVAHIEAGLRSFNEYQPEEINRRLTDHISNVLFATSSSAVQQLITEGISSKKVFDVGDIMCDAVGLVKQNIKMSGVAKKYDVTNKAFILTTIHRPENTDDKERLQCIFESLLEVSKHYPVLLPLHPRTTEALKRAKLFDRYDKHLKIIKPVSFTDMIALNTMAQLIVTDSGGLQKEAFYCGAPCAVLRDETEWQELIDLGCNKLIAPSRDTSMADAILESVHMLNVNVANPYGDGHSAEKIIDILLNVEGLEA